MRPILAILSLAAYAAAALAQDLELPLKNASLTGTITSESITVNGTLTINKSPMSATFSQAETSPSSGGVAAKELVITAGGQYSNVLALENPATDGYSALTLRVAGAEKLAIGSGGPDTGALYAGKNYFETWPGNDTDPPPDLEFLADGNYGLLGSGGRVYRRAMLTWNAGESAGQFNFYHLIPWATGSEQKLSIQLVTQAIASTSGDIPKIKLITSESDCAIQFSKDQSDSATWCVGNSVPGVGMTSDLCISSVTSSTWHERLRLNNAGTILSFGGQTSSQPALKVSSATLQARLADDSGFTAIQSLYERHGSGSPEGVVTAPIGAIYHRTDGGAGTSNYFKESGTGNTGWVGK